MNIADVRALRGVLENGAAQMVGLIVLEPLGATKERNFARFMAEAGDMEIRGHMNPYARMQLLTVEDILDGKRFRTPGAVGRGSPQIDWMTAEGVYEWSGGSASWARGLSPVSFCSSGCCKTVVSTNRS